jgi:hypothetical protein
MAIGLVKGRSSVFLKEEATEGVYIAPASAADAVEVLEDGLEFNYSRDEIERNTLSATIEVEASRVGLKQITGTIPVEFKAGAAAGAEPRGSILYESLLGGKRQLGSTITTKTGNSATVLQINDLDIAAFSKGDCVLVKEAGNYEVRPISDIDTTPGSATITLAFALEGGAPSDNVVIEKYTTYYHQENGPSFSATHYAGGEIEESISGLKAISASLENWSTAQLASWSFTVEGLGLDRAVGTPAYTPDFSADALPPVLLNACIWINGVKTQYSELSLSLENTKSEIQGPCSDSGKIGARFTQFVCSGELTAYAEDDDVDRFDAFNNNDDISIFGYAYNPTAIAGQGKEYIAFWIPQAKVTSIPFGDVDGIISDQISFKAYKKEGGDSVFLSFI